jgi:[acyl-carrier-protein] S-malonyltransferase
VEETLHSLEEVYPANFNSPTQTVISGTAQGLARAEARLKEAGSKRVVRLKVSGPFHCPLLEEARKKFEEVLKTARFHDPQIPLYSNVTGKKISSGEEARALAGAQIVSPVRWTQVEQAVKEEGFTEVLETGPGTVLTGLWKALFPEPACKPVGRWDEILRFSL